MGMKKNRHILIEIDGDRWAATIADIRPGSYAVLKTHQVDDVQREMATQIVDWLSDEGHIAQPVHVAIADEHVVRFQINLPRLSRSERLAVVERQARAACSLSAEAPIEVAHRALGKAEKKLTKHAVLAVPHRGVLGELMCHGDVKLATVCDSGEAVLHALPADLPEHLAVVDANSQGIRITYLQAGVPVQERSINLEREARVDMDALVRTLELEIPRTIDYVVDLGLPAPEAVAFAPSLGLLEESQREVAQDLQIIPIDMQGPRPADEVRLGLATIGLLQHLSRGRGLTVLDLKVAMPVALGKPILSALLIAMAVMGARNVVTFTRDGELLRTRASQLNTLVAAWQLEQERVEEEMLRTDRADLARINGILGMRRPASRLFAEVSNRAPTNTFLTEFTCTEDDGIRLEGHVDGSTRLDAIRLLAQYRAELMDVPFLQDVEETVRYDEQAGREETLLFSIDGRWRAP